MIISIEPALREFVQLQYASQNEGRSHLRKGWHRQQTNSRNVQQVDLDESQISKLELHALFHPKINYFLAFTRVKLKFDCFSRFN